MQLILHLLLIFLFRTQSAGEGLIVPSESVESSVECFEKESLLSAEIASHARAVELDTSDPSLHFGFSFDEQPGLGDHPGPSPSVILQVLL